MESHELPAAQQIMLDFFKKVDPNLEWHEARCGCCITIHFGDTSLPIFAAIINERGFYELEG